MSDQLVGRLCWLHICSAANSNGKRASSAECDAQDDQSLSASLVLGLHLHPPVDVRANAVVRNERSGCSSSKQYLRLSRILSCLTFLSYTPPIVVGGGHISGVLAGVWTRDPRTTCCYHANIIFIVCLSLVSIVMSVGAAAGGGWSPQEGA